MDKDHRWIVNSLIAVIVPAALAGLVRAADKPARSSEGAKWLEYGMAMKAFAVAGALIPVALTVVLVVTKPADPSGLLGVIAIFSALVMPLLLENFLVKIGFDETHIFTRSAWRRSRVIPWSEVGEPSRSDLLQWWRIPTKTHGTIRIQDFISGKEDFFEMLDKKRRQETGEAAAPA